MNDLIGITGIRCYEMTMPDAKPQNRVEARGFHSLSLRLSGEVSFTFDGRTSVSGKDMLTFVPEHTSYETQVLSPGRIQVIHFSTAGALQEQPCVIRPEDPAVYRDLFAALFRARDSYSAASHLYALFARLRVEHGLRHDGRLDAALQYLEANLSDPELSVKRLADYTGVSEVYFRKLFHRHYGMQPVAYLKKRRMELAKALLSTGYYSIGEVGARCGYGYPSYFASEFRKETGMTPSAYMGRD